MRFLLDTHIMLWSLALPHRLSSTASRLLADPSNSICISAVSVWEIAIKRAVAKRDIPTVTARDLLRFANEAGFSLIDMRVEHAIAVDDLPRVHADPFDRILVAQALVEDRILLTSDRTLAGYGAPVQPV